MERLVGRGAAQTVAAGAALGGDSCAERHHGDQQEKLSRLSGLEVSFLMVTIISMPGFFVQISTM